LLAGDKIIKPVLILVLYLALIVNGRWSKRMAISGYLVPASLFFLVIFVHFVLTLSIPNVDPGAKEIVRYFAFIIILIACSMVKLKTVDYLFLFRLLALIGVPLALFAIQQGFFGADVGKSWKYIGGVLRAGTDIVDANSLGAVLNIMSLSALGCYLVAKGVLEKMLFFIAFLVEQAARFTTFSSGSFISFVLSILVLLYFMRKYDKKMFKQYIVVVWVGAAVMFGGMLYYGLIETAFYRLTLSDDNVYEASVGSRWGQYVDLVKIITEEPQVFLVGVGPALIKYKMSNGLDFHNSYIRSLLSAGIIGFVCFMYLWWRSMRNYLQAIGYAYQKNESAVLYVILCSMFIGWSFQSATVPADTSVVFWFYLILAYSLDNKAYYTKDEAVVALKNMDKTDKNIEEKYVSCRLRRQ
jgi:hypothetical protein